MPEQRGTKKRRYTPEQVYVAVEVAHIAGIRPASRLTGIPLVTLFEWKERDEQKLLDELVTKKYSGEEVSDVREHNRGEFSKKALELINHALEQMESKMDEASFKDLATGVGILIDKICLVSGMATSRTEHVTGAASREELLEVAAQVADRVKRLPRHEG
ncbi:MAG: hypothetical protein A4E56_02649 [Pelotomaculum sp. PtaU1.Bin065]|nr:MAG: hypothetical protein A4E56_02649 [Pelotomaculum sp. PtaU1.Bin065]